MGKCFLTKRYKLRCSHQLQECHNTALKIKETSFHGHSMDLYVTFKGLIDSESGLIIDRDKTDAILKMHIIDKYDKKNLNKLLAIPTGEELTLAITKDLMNSPLSTTIHQIQIKETEKNFFSGPICNE